MRHYQPAGRAETRRAKASRKEKMNHRSFPGDRSSHPAGATYGNALQELKAAPESGNRPVLQRRLGAGWGRSFEDMPAPATAWVTRSPCAAGPRPAACARLPVSRTAVSLSLLAGNSPLSEGVARAPCRPGLCASSLGLATGPSWPGIAPGGGGGGSQRTAAGRGRADDAESPGPRH